jgi:hypothetical protein
MKLVVLQSDIIAPYMVAEVTPSGTTIGRQKSFESRLCLPELSVSRYHSIIFTNQDEYMITDCGSSHGTFINHRLISNLKTASEPIAISHLDRIQIGSTTFEAHIHDSCQDCLGARLNLDPTATEHRVKKPRLPQHLDKKPDTTLSKNLETFKSVTSSHSKPRIEPPTVIPHRKPMDLPIPIAPPKRKIDEPIDNSNKGSVLLKKMGWLGNGLGAMEDGRTDPLQVQKTKGNRGIGFKGNK